MIGVIKRVFCVVFLSLICFPCSVWADDDYYLADVSSGSIVEYNHYGDYYSARNAYENNKNFYNNLVLYHGDQVLAMEYGVVEFVNDEDGALNVAYHSITNNCETVINSVYGCDGAYLSTSYDGQYVYFVMAGDRGYTSFDDVILHPYELLENGFSVYGNFNGAFCHLIKNDLDSPNFYRSLAIDEPLSYLRDNVYYYSYDGHYFYDNFYTMINDYHSGFNLLSLNISDAYFNYYQYLPVRSFTNYDISDFEQYFYQQLGINSKLRYYDDQSFDGVNDVLNASAYYEELAGFIQYQNQYGTNALMLLADSMYESSLGRSLSAYKSNNLFGEMAFDSQEERDNNSYSHISDSIEAFSKYLLNYKYGNRSSSLYRGSHLGNKISGICQNYSTNAYYGETIAANMYRIDKALGLRDYKAYSFGIVSNNDNLVLYSDANLTTVMGSLSGLRHNTFVVLAENAFSYKIQLDPDNNDYSYDFNDNVAYVYKAAFNKVFNPEKIHEFDLVNINYDLGEDSFSVVCLRGTTPVICDPCLNSGYLHNFNNNLKKASEDKTYSADFKTITDLELLGLPDRLVMGEYLDLRDVTLRIYYNNGHDDIPCSVDRIRGFDENVEGKQEVVLSYGGFSKTISLSVSSSLRDEKEALYALIEKNIASYNLDGSYNLSELRQIKNNIGDYDFDFDFEVLRTIDKIMLEAFENKANYNIYENNYELTISGMTLSLADKDITSLFKPFKDTYYVHIGNVSSRAKSAFNNLGETYNLAIVDYFGLSFQLNMENCELQGATIVSLKLPDMDNSLRYSVYRYDENGAIVKLRTTQSSTGVQFLTKESGDFVILSQDTNNIIIMDDVLENITMDNVSADGHSYSLLGLFLASTLIIGVLGIVIYFVIKKREEELWKDYRKSFLRADCVPDVRPKN